jgi:hypothetical protein
MIKLFEWVKNNFYLFGTTAFPGVHKIVLLFVVNAFFSLEITADFINDIFILYLLGYLTVFNWANFILSDMMKLPKMRQRMFFGKISALSFMVNLPLILLVLGLFHWHLLTDFVGFSILMISWSYQQLWRHYMIATKNYRKLFYTDSGVLFFTLISIWLTHKMGGNVYLMMSFPTIIVPMFFDRLPYFLPDLKWNSRIFKRVLNYTLINLSTGGIQLIFAPLSHQLLSADFTRVIGFVNNIAAMVLLIPRALAYNYMPKLAQCIRVNKSEFMNQFINYETKLFRLLLLLLIFGFFTFFISLYFKFGFNILISAIAFCTYLNLLSSQLSLPVSNALVVKSESFILMKYNIVYFFITVVTLYVNLMSEILPEMIMLVMLCSAILYNTARYFFLKHELNSA